MQSPLARWFKAQLQPKRQGRASGVGGSLGVQIPRGEVWRRGGEWEFDGVT
jgi:hypothetical protein